MNNRNLQARIIKLETSTARLDETLVVWRRPGAEVTAALQGIPFARGDKVICVEWSGDAPMPAPRWYKERLETEMPSAEHKQLEQALEAVANGHSSEAASVNAGLNPFPRLNEERMREMSDTDLVHSIFGVQT